MGIFGIGQDLSDIALSIISTSQSNCTGIIRLGVHMKSISDVDTTLKSNEMCELIE